MEEVKNIEITTEVNSPKKEMTDEQKEQIKERAFETMMKYQKLDNIKENADIARSFIHRRSQSQRRKHERRTNKKH
jgi:hypothetical protein